MIGNYCFLIKIDGRIKPCNYLYDLDNNDINAVPLFQMALFMKKYSRIYFIVNQIVLDRKSVV